MQKFYTVVSILFLFIHPLRSQVSISGVVNIYTNAVAIDYCTNSIELVSTAGFSAGDRILVIQMKGADITLSNTAAFGNLVSYNGAGNYEFATITSVSGSLISLEYAL